VSVHRHSIQQEMCGATQSLLLRACRILSGNWTYMREYFALGIKKKGVGCF